MAESGISLPNQTTAIGGLAFELAAEAMMIVTTSGQLAAANQAAQELYGFSRHEFLGLRRSELADGSAAARLLLDSPQRVPRPSVVRAGRRITYRPYRVANRTPSDRRIPSTSPSL